MKFFFINCSQEIGRRRLRKLNVNTIKDTYSLPNITEILDQLGQSNLASGFHQNELGKKYRGKTAFSACA